MSKRTFEGWHGVDATVELDMSEEAVVGDGRSDFTVRIKAKKKHQLMDPGTMEKFNLLLWSDAIVNLEGDIMPDPQVAGRTAIVESDTEFYSEDNWSAEFAVKGSFELDPKRTYSDNHAGLYLCFSVSGEKTIAIPGEPTKTHKAGWQVIAEYIQIQVDVEAPE